MKSLKAIFSSLLWLLPCLMWAQNRQWVFKNMTIVTGSGSIIHNATAIISGPRFVYVGADEEAIGQYNASDTVISLPGHTLYPALIIMATRLGLTEIDAVRATRDFREVGVFNPTVRTAPAFNAESAIIPTVATHGILYAQVIPEGALLAGSSSVFALAGNQWEADLRRMDEGMHLYWPRMPEILKSKTDTARTEERKKYLMELDRRFAEAAALHKAAKTKDVGMLPKALFPLFEGKMRLYIHAEGALEMAEALQFAERHGISVKTIVGGTSLLHISDLLLKTNTSVVLQRVHSLPDTPDQAIDLPFTLAAELHRKGITFCFSTLGDMEAANTRNLPFQVGTAVAYGLPMDAAIQSLTLQPAKLLGINQDLGSVEAGKLASFFILQGAADALFEMRTPLPTHLFFEGKPHQPKDRQMELYRKYK